MFTPRLFKIRLHTRRVLMLKRLLPIFAFLLASLMLAWPSLIAPPKEQFSVAVASDKKSMAANVDMERVRFYSLDDKAQPLTVSAPKVLETDLKRQIITLYKPEASYQMQNGVKLTAKTPYGLYYQEENKLLFEDKVNITTNNGYRAVATDVICDNKSEDVRSDSLVKITGPAGQLKARGFRIYNKGDNLDFSGKTDTTLNNESGTIRVQSEKELRIDQVAQTITAFQNVMVTQQERTITADKMTLTYNTRDQDSKNTIRTITAVGHVVAWSGTHKITGNRGIYNPKTGIVEMTGNVVLYQGSSHIDGDKATLNLITGESNLTPKTTPEQSGRIKGTLVPKELKETAK